MIFSIILFLSCSQSKSVSSIVVNSDEVLLLPIDSKQSILASNQTLQEKSQIHLLSGFQNGDIDDYVLARSYGVQCLQEIIRFSFVQLEEIDIQWSVIPIETKGACNDENPSLFMAMPAHPKSVACMTWTIAAWSELIQGYNLEASVMNAKSLLVLTSWLDEHRQCIDSPLVPFAVATGLMYGFDSAESQTRLKDRRQYALSLIQSLWDHPDVRDVVRFWYIQHRVHEGEVSMEERSIWISALKEGGLGTKSNKTKDLVRFLEELRPQRKRK